MADAAAEWVLLRRCGDPLEAQVTVDFLRDHGVTVALQGNSAITNVFNGYGGNVAVRLMVPPGQLGPAREVLEAMTSAEVIDDPPLATQLQEEDDEGDEEGDEEGVDLAGHPYRDPPVSRALARAARPAWWASVLAVVVPIGLGHAYAQHSATALLLALGAIACIVLGALRSPPLLAAWGVLVALDAVFGYRAARRSASGRVPPGTVQIAWGVAALMVAALAGVMVGALLKR